MGIDLYNCVYAATIAAGGIFGYAKTGSKPSLGAGLAFGAVLGYGAYLTSQSPPKPEVALGASALLATMMLARAAKSKKFLPTAIGTLAATSLAYNLFVYYPYISLSLPTKGDASNQKMRSISEI